MREKVSRRVQLTPRRPNFLRSPELRPSSGSVTTPGHKIAPRLEVYRIDFTVGATCFISCTWPVLLLRLDAFFLAAAARPGISRACAAAPPRDQTVGTGAPSAQLLLTLGYSTWTLGMQDLMFA